MSFSTLSVAVLLLDRSPGLPPALSSVFFVVLLLDRSPGLLLVVLALVPALVAVLVFVISVGASLLSFAVPSWWFRVLSPGLLVLVPSSVVNYFFIFF